MGYAEGRTDELHWPSSAVPSGSTNRAWMNGGTPGTWEALSFPPTTMRLGKPQSKEPWPRNGSADAPGRHEQRALGWYHQVKETKRGGTNGWASEQLVVAGKAGNRSEGPAGAKGLPEHGTTGGKDVGELRPHKRLHETTADSEIGEADAREGYDLAVPSHGFGLDDRSLPTHPQGWGGGY